MTQKRLVPWLGVVADDYTGAADLAGMLVRVGVTTVQLLGVPLEEAEIPYAECLIISLKSRTMPTELAVAESVAAARWLSQRGAKQIYYKYCSTFDSTATGNIGPVTDALAHEVGAKLTVICPAVPENGRTVYQGNLFVHEKPLAESSMKDHPLTPMTDSNLIRLFERQSALSAGRVSLSTVRQGPTAIEQHFKLLIDSGVTVAVVDAVADDDLLAIGQAVRDEPLVTGSAGLALGMARARNSSRPIAPTSRPLPAGASVVLSGSCSAATQNQVAIFKATHPSYEIDPYRIKSGVDVVQEILDFAEFNLEKVPLIYSSADPNRVRQIQIDLGTSESADLIECTFAEVARRLVASGARRLVIAGGETSGAVVSGLGITALEVGREIDPGVPWTISLSNPPLALLLKSGNFGTDDVFTKAIEENYEQ
ncbi:four-carbon acid sugar kinase family protein [Cryobacterium suzukii]|uniref:3-oxo-tetronate kinase n=1 Tax=Cryobacterium suzukii TaxID=1259198 RepID=A0A4R9AIU6_9MICO|nr:3-oxo-tetronate kinase [Cryobacterium suzukii]TFD62552.1 four-carbon acid sugar kinase family protein [Cryobacterium suzukii]